MVGLTCVVWFKAENIWFSGKGIHVVHLVVFILIAVNQINNIIPFSGTKMYFSAV